MIFFDSHCHLDDLAYTNDFSIVLHRAFINKISALILIGIDEETSFRAQYLSQIYKKIYSAIGFHPHNASKCSDYSLEKLKKLSNHFKVIAWGEIGLDFNRNNSNIKDQESALIRQIMLAKKLNFPIIFHDRDSNGRLMEIVKVYYNKCGYGVIHCFSGKYSDLKKYLDLGFFLGITGIVCMCRRGFTLRDLAKKIPFDRLLIETDAPYLLPQRRYNNGKRNESSFITSVLFNLAKIKKENVFILSEQLWKNTCLFFKIDY